MITIFDFLNDIIACKTGNLIENFEDKKLYQSYLVNRWLSFYNSSSCTFINETVNRYWNIILQDEQYRFLVETFPKNKVKRISYIKKIREEADPKRKELIEFLAQKLELSQREVEDYLNSDKLDVKGLQKVICSK